jgi:hypothetical protein
MSASSEANSLGSFFALGKQTTKGTAATALQRALATASGLMPIMADRESPLEHPSPSASVLNTRRKTYTKHPSYLAGAQATFLCHPKFLPMALMGAGFTITSAGTSPVYTHTCVLATGAAHRWMTAAWNVDETDGAFVTRGVDMRATQFGMSISPDQIECNMTMRGLKVEPMSGSPTYTAEVIDEIVPWLGARTTLSVNGYAIVERVRSIEFSIENTLREDDRAVWEPALTGLSQQNIDISMAFNEVNISDDIFEALAYGAANGTAMDITPITGAIDVRWQSEDNIPTGASPYSVQIAIPDVEWMYDPESFQASGDDFIAPSMTAYMVNRSGSAPITVTVVNDVASY